MICNFIFVFLIMYFSGRRIKKGLKVFFEQEKKQMPKLPNKSIALVVASIESLIVTKIFTPNIILLMSNTAVGETDPIFGLDISFFMSDCEFYLAIQFITIHNQIIFVIITNSKPIESNVNTR